MALRLSGPFFDGTWEEMDGTDTFSGLSRRVDRAHEL